MSFRVTFASAIVLSGVLCLGDAPCAAGQNTANPQSAPETQALRARAEAGDIAAQIDLGNRYRSGQGVPKDDVQAVAWYRKAANQGSATAQYNLGVSYTAGRGVPQDFVAAHMWFSLAASRVSGKYENKYAEARDDLANRMTPAQIADAQQRARAWPQAKQKEP
jgi:TPR repeat protein